MTAPSIHACLRALEEHKQARLAALPKAVKKWRRDYYWLCPECGSTLACAEPTVLNSPAVDTRDATISDRGPMTLLWSCVKRCRTVESADQAEPDDRDGDSATEDEHDQQHVPHDP